MCYDGEAPRVFERRVIVARKPRRCCECRGTIPPRACYERVRGLWDGHWAEYATCDDCADLRATIAEHEAAEGCHGAVAAPPYGALWDAACGDGVACRVDCARCREAAEDDDAAA